MSVEHAGLFLTVLPVVGLLAETTESGGLREPHAWALAALADAWNADDTPEVLTSSMMFLGEPGAVDRPVRQRHVA